MVNAAQLVQIFHDDTSHKDKRVSRAKYIVERLPTAELRKKYSAELTSLMLSVDRREDLNDKSKWELLERHYREQALALGINLYLAEEDIADDDERSRDALLARIIEFGIRDLNPTPLLKNCQHLVFEYSGGISMYAEMLRLPSAGRKRLGCIKHLEHGALDGYSLAELYSKFSSSFCAGCADASPQDERWEYDEEWHKKQIDLLRRTQQELRNQRPHFR